jgi:2-hydroxycyclohexanecarboxyl-CoA dehydrogenase
MKGRAAFVCAADAGLGQAVAQALATRGARVGLALSETAAGTPGPAPGVDGVELVSVDVGQRASVVAAVAAVRSACGPIEILVNCPQGPDDRPFLETDESEWRAVVQAALMGVFRVTKEVLPDMVSRSSGRVVNVAPDSGRTGGARQAIYAGCGGGVIAFTKTIARELARCSVTANTVCYGPTPSPSAAPTAAGGPDGRLRAIPLGRLGTAAELAAAVAFLASEEAGFVTGQTLSVNGGTSMV